MMNNKQKYLTLFFSQSSQLAMHNVLQNDSEYIMQLAALSSSLNVRHRESKSLDNDLKKLVQDYHSGCVNILEDMVKQLK